MKRNSFSVLFFIRKTRLLKNGEAPINLRVTVNGQRAEIQIPRSIPLKKWDCKKGCAKGNCKRHENNNDCILFQAMKQF